MPAPDVETSPIARDLAARILPALIRQIEARKAAWLAGAGGFLQRQAVKYAWPWAMRALPETVEAGAAALLDEFGTMTLAEVAQRLIVHQRARGRLVHRSFLQAPPDRS